MQMAAERLAMAAEQPALVSFPALPQIPVAAAPAGLAPPGTISAPSASLPALAPVPAAPAVVDMAAAPGPAPAAAAVLPKPPPAGSLLERIGNKLAKEHQKLATVSQSLLSVNGLVESTEQSLLGKVLDVETARGLAAKHQEIDAANERARGQIRDLGAQISNLNTLLAAAEKTYEMQQAAQRKAEGELEKQLKAKVDALAAQAQKAISSLPGLALLNKRLRANRTQMQAEDVAARKKINASSIELDQILKALEIEKMEEARLRRGLIDIHNYSSSCHVQAESLEASVLELSKKMPKQSAAAAASEMQGEATQKANNERLRAEVALLQAEIQRVDHAGQDALGSLTTDRTALNLLETNIIVQVRNISNKTHQAKTRTLLLQQAVQANIGQIEEAMGQKKGLTKDLHNWQQRVSPVVFAALQAENDALEKELAGAVDLVTQANVEEAKAFAQVQQFAADREAQEAAADAAAQSVITAEEEGQKQLEKAVAAAKASKEKSAALLQKANDALRAACKPKWDKREEETAKEKEECDANAQQLAVVQAQQEMLKQTVQAAQTAQEAAEG